jgi:hypothetical protein
LRYEQFAICSNDPNDSSIHPALVQVRYEIDSKHYDGVYDSGPGDAANGIWAPIGGPRNPGFFLAGRFSENPPKIRKQISNHELIDERFF